MHNAPTRLSDESTAIMNNNKSKKYTLADDSRRVSVYDGELTRYGPEERISLECSRNDRHGLLRKREESHFPSSIPLLCQILVLVT